LQLRLLLGLLSLLSQKLLSLKLLPSCRLFLLLLLLFLDLVHRQLLLRVPFSLKLLHFFLKYCVQTSLDLLDWLQLLVLVGDSLLSG
jgi:hypothetical protein